MQKSTKKLYFKNSSNEKSFEKFFKIIHKFLCTHESGSLVTFLMFIIHLKIIFGNMQQLWAPRLVVTPSKIFDFVARNKFEI